MHRTTGDNYALDANGNRVFTEGPPPTTVDAGILNSIQEEIANAIEASGQTLYDTPGSDLNNQLALAIQKVTAYDSIVYSQETFNAIWERVGDNEYQILDTIGSVYFKAYFGGYNMSGPNSPLSGGDTWGRFKTNNCTFIMCDGGNVFQMGDTQSYWEISSSNTVVYNMDVRGVGAVAAAIEYSIRVANFITGCSLLFPKVSLRYSSSPQYVISAHTQDNIVVGADITLCDNSANSFFGIFNFSNVVGCRIHDLTLTTAAASYGFYSTGGILGHTNCVVEDIIATGAFTAFTNSIVSGSRVYNVVAGGNALGFTGNSISACYVRHLESTAGTATGFSGCSSLSASYAQAVLSAALSAYGFYDCTELSGCKAYDIETSINNASYKAVGFQDCDQLSACTADTIAASAANAYAYGFHTCKRLSACYAVTVTAATASRAYGYYTCTHMDGSCEAASVDDFEFYTCDQQVFLGSAAAATPYGYTEVLQSAVLLNGSTYTHTPLYDGFLFGYVNMNAGVGHLVIRIGNSAKNRDMVVRCEGTTGGADRGQGSFMIPCLKGQSVYFTAADANIAPWYLRYMPFGTTT